MERRPLVITDDSELLDDVLRIAAATGVEVDHAREAPARGQWRAAPLIVIDVGKVPRAVLAGLPRRDGVIALARTEPDSRLWEHCVRLGVQRTLLLGEAEDYLVEMLAGSQGELTGDGRAIAVIGACGGAGASVLAAAVAVAVHRSGRPVLLADCDRWGPGLDVVLGIEEEDGVRWSDLAAPAGRLAPDTLHRALPAMAVARGQIPVLSFDRSSGQDVPVSVVEVVIDSARRAGDVAVVDLPRAPTPAGDRMAEIADLTVLLVPADVRGCFAARRQVVRLSDVGARLGVVVRGPSPGGLGADDIAEVLGVPLLAFMRPQARLVRDLELGRPPGADPRSPLGKAARAVVAAAEAVPV
ncbi:MAG: septum site-determining protein Ssd [Nakamurella sp.]